HHGSASNTWNRVLGYQHGAIWQTCESRDCRTSTPYRCCSLLNESSVPRTWRSDARDISSPLPGTIRDPADAIHLLKPLRTAFVGPILSSAIIDSPSPFAAAFRRDPRSVLLDIQPISRTERDVNRDMVPILFQQNSETYVGWQ